MNFVTHLALHFGDFDDVDVGVTTVVIAEETMQASSGNIASGNRGFRA